MPSLTRRALMILTLVIVMGWAANAAAHRRGGLPLLHPVPPPAAQTLSKIKQDMEKRLEELQALQGRLMETLEEEKRIKGEQNRHLVATLQAMSPDRAGKLLEQMEEEEAVRLLRRLPGKEAGAILSLLAPDKAARLSHRFLQ